MDPVPVLNSSCVTLKFLTILSLRTMVPPYLAYMPCTMEVDPASPADPQLIRPLRRRPQSEHGRQRNLPRDCTARVRPKQSLRVGPRAPWNPLLKLDVRPLIPVDDVPGDLRINQAGIHRIDADAVFDLLERSRPRKADYPMLGGDVRRDAGVAGQRADGRIVDNRAAALSFHLPQLVLHATPHALKIDPDHTVPFFGVPPVSRRI
jgi:hypothetical protein